MGKHSRSSFVGRRGDDPDAPFTLDADGGPGPRAQRLEHLMFEELDRLFRLEVSDPRLSDVVPTAVEISPDLRNAKIRFAIRNAPDHGPKGRGPQAHAAIRGVQDGLLRVTPFLRVRLADAVSMKRIPELHFHRDRIAEASLRAADLLLTAGSRPPAEAELADADTDGDEGLASAAPQTTGADAHG